MQKDCFNKRRLFNFIKMNESQYSCEVCKIILNEQDRASHEIGKRHKKSLGQANNVNLKEIKTTPSTHQGPDSPPGMLIIQGYPSYTRKNELENYINEFGRLRVTHFKSYAIVLCDDKGLCENLVSEKINLFIYGKQLKVSHYRPEAQQRKQQKGRQFQRSKTKELIIEPEELDLSGGFSEQCDSILFNIRLSREEVESISLLYSNVTELFQYLWPGCTAVPFGSITTGLGIKTSDADCFIDIPREFRQDPNYNYVQKARAIMRRFPHIFSEIVAIPRANTPIVKFFHIPTNMNCDVSFKSPLGTRNSKLIAFFLRTDPRILNLCILIKYWAKIHDLTGTGKVSNYALTIMVIFYLQQQPNPLLHSVEMLQRTQSYYVDGWNTGFIDQHHLIPYLRNDKSLKDLMGGFFQYYKQFNYKDLVICPYLGLPVPRNHFNNVNNLSDFFYVYKKRAVEDPLVQLKPKSEIVIQDPFEQCRNVTSCVGFNLYHKFIQSIEWAADIYKRDTTSGTDNFLKNILLEKPKLRAVVSNMNVKVMLDPFTLKNLPDETWTDLVERAFTHIFKDILQFSLNKQVRDNASPAGSNKNIETYLCKASNLVWQQRKNCDDPSSDFLTNQIALTKKIVSEKKGKAVSMHVFADIICLKKEKRSHVILKKENDEDNNFPRFGQFCLSHVNVWFKKLLLNHVTNTLNENKLIDKNIAKSSTQGESTNAENEKNIQKLTENEVNKDAEQEMEDCVGVIGSRKSASKSKGIPIVKNEFSETQNLSPDNNPPSKIQKTV